MRRRVESALYVDMGAIPPLFNSIIWIHRRSLLASEFRGITRSLAKLREEAAKCVLLCANCHAELEVGATALPVKSPAVDVEPGS